MAFKKKLIFATTYDTWCLYREERIWERNKFLNLIKEQKLKFPYNHPYMDGHKITGTHMNTMIPI